MTLHRQNTHRNLNLRHACRALLVLGSLALGGPLAAQDGAPAPADEPQPLVSVNGFMIDSLHLGLFASQTGRNPQRPDDQIRLLNELVNNVMVATSAEGEALAAIPEVARALEVARARLIAQTYVRSLIDRIELEESELRARYEAEYGEPKREYKARHILLKTEQDARAVIDELEAGGDFASLAEQHSTGPSKAVGGDLGWFGPEQMVAEFAEATAELENGAFTRQPVKTRFGWHVILREDSRDLPPPTFESVRNELESEIKQERVAEEIAKIREKAEIEVQNPEG